MTRTRPAPVAGPRDRATRAYEQLRELIVTGKLAPGAWIIETDVAEHLGISRTPVREALQRLEQEGYVLGNPRGQQYRAAVAPLTQRDARELFALVGELEALAARACTELPDGAREVLATDLRALNRDLQRAAAGRPDQGVLFDTDTAFHLRYVSAGAGPRLRALYAATRPQAERYLRLYYGTLAEEVAASAREHEAILEAIRLGDGDAAQRAVETNWRNAAERLGRVIQTAGERGSW